MSTAHAVSLQIGRVFCCTGFYRDDQAIRVEHSHTLSIVGLWSQASTPLEGASPSAVSQRRGLAALTADFGVLLHGCLSKK
jgi:hypothetical protein